MRVHSLPWGSPASLLLQSVLDVYGRKGAVMDEVVALWYASEALRLVETLHAAGFVHCAIAPAAFGIREAE